ncbi:hypothetical protein [Polyangium mundeleinium]|uniref:DUF4304 domain-containing protein n=1 Tax=Polyangium mundeleinium TaxID=2995306 RepID=A0ABT5F044_9BACT|nr:hypothetical protein [Polyangium mundeleinium]MDC0746425.1 hypothetical protein [Polyangium mundeleinium]
MKSFEAELQTRFPQFVPFDSERNTRTWSWKASPDLVFFVTVQAFVRLDQFVVEVSWAETEEFPWGAIGHVNVDQPRGRERLGLFWKSGPDEPVWDVCPEKSARMSEYLEAVCEGNTASIPADPPMAQILPRVLPLVRDAMDKFEEYGMPLFHRVAEAHGIAIGSRTT